MARTGLEQRMKNVERRLTAAEQILPTLATKADLTAAIRAAIEPLATRAELAAAIEPLATRAELAAAIEPLATRAELTAAIEPLATRAELQALKTDLQTTLASKAELREEGERTRRYFDVVAESLRDDIRIIAEGFATSQQRMDSIYGELREANSRLDHRVTKLEASRPGRR